MKRIIVFLFINIFALTSITFAEAPQPTQKIVLFYKVADEALKVQNNAENMVEGKKELEKELLKHYNKRFIVEDIKRLTQDTFTTATDYFKNAKQDQMPFIVTIKITGKDQLTQVFPAINNVQRFGVSPAVNIHLIEKMPSSEDKTFYSYDYGIKKYSAGTFTIGKGIFIVQEDIRENTKNAIISSFRDACEFNEKIDKEKYPATYKNEYNRYTGNFKQIPLNKVETIFEQKIRIANYKKWCEADTKRKKYPYLINDYDINASIKHIDRLIKIGLYEE